MKYKAVLFDMDGVLILSEPVTAEAAVLAMRSFGIACRKEDFLPFVGKGEQGYLGGVAEKYGKPYEPSMASELYRAYASLISPSHKPPQLDRVLTLLQQKGYRLAVCSSANACKVRLNLGAIEHDASFFDAIITGSDVRLRKPNPEVFLLGCNKLSLSPPDCVVVEDSISGIQAAKAGGFTCIAICSTLSKTQIQSASSPDYICNSLADILDFL